MFREANLSWDSPISCNALLCERFIFLVDKKRVVVFGRCGMIAICCVVWIERNRRTFYYMKRETVD